MLPTLDTIHIFIHTVYGSTTLHIVFAILVIFHTPFAPYPMYLVISSIMHSGEKYFENRNLSKRIIVS